MINNNNRNVLNVYNINNNSRDENANHLHNR